ncbi:hypothetical protein LCGC14_2069860 [marine sediment metagenome]|uniref:Uncharacterized protein n=1 Tax=marine sediment metagenome TaxID=412755 RepID=A0A0F9GX59_9ZZZZ
MKVLVACEFSGTVRDAFIRAGHDAMSCDLLPTESPGPHYQGDMWDTNITKQHWDLAIIHPTCQYLCNSGVRWLYEHPWRMNLMRAGAYFFKAALDDFPAERVAAENPIMHKYAIEIIGRGHDQLVQPSWFGDKKTKATCWWLKNLPLLVKTNDVGPAPKSGTPEYAEWAECHHASPGADRWKLRSTFYPGMADACAAQWGSK